MQNKPINHRPLHSVFVRRFLRQLTHKDLIRTNFDAILARRHVEGGGRSKCQFGMSPHRPPSDRNRFGPSEDKHDLRGQLWRRRRKRGSNEMNRQLSE